MDRHVELFYEPIEILGYLSDGDKAEMTGNEMAFLCGLIKKYQPKKLVEIGVAAGSSTAVVLNCLSMLEMETEVFSIDLEKYYYRGKNKRTGYLAEECKERLRRDPKHILFTGKYAVEQIEKIGNDIDFLILDTVHRLPGELLDFLAYYPFLKKGCVVVCHDLALNHQSDLTCAYATKLLFDVVTAEKFLDLDSENEFPNIGAFIITDDTDRGIENVFSALTISWGYMPKDEEISLYRKLFQEYYSHMLVEFYDRAVRMNKRTLKRELHMKWDEFLGLNRWIESIRVKRIYIYGCGNYGRQFCRMLRECNIEVAGYIISDGQKKCDCDAEVYYLSEVDFNKETDGILIGVDILQQTEIIKKLNDAGITDFILPDNRIFNYLEK